MPVRGKKISATLQSVTVTQNATTGKDEATTTTVKTFLTKTLQTLSSQEALIFNKETLEGFHKTLVDHDALGDTAAAAIKVHGNQLVIASKTYDITGYEEWNENPIHYYRVFLRETDVDN